ncbi:NADH-quinone oxidoreductase subunit NuoF [Candidatus Acetothermia bacterium]|jgi:NADH:ubiquinone oxidoreductase subunit F (NADH-binding)/(2Fe-2S) ferredoxin/NAD-dependent dihydropyrimidine dehydrogenase PreA subunit|nr:NADH-quinone oxidoreductase subunit NuoF [Candidatus Acetothermia bacterium]
MTEAFYRANALVCRGTGCVASGADKIFNLLKVEIARRGLEDEVRVIFTGCHGLCEMGPLVIIYPEGILYCRVQEKDIPHLVEETFVKGRVVEALTYKEPISHQALPHYSEMPFYAKQQRIVLGNCGVINPENIEEYIARGGYEALGKALFEMNPEDVIEEIKRSILRGRGGAGFPTGRKWEFAYRAPGEVKYVVCNGDEGDPGAFMNRSLLEGDPHRVLEGMLIAAYAIGARQGYIYYVRAEYPLAVKRLQQAIDDAQGYSLIGDGILGSDFSCQIDIMEGAGAFVCGEETAMIAAMEGRRGMPRQRPPFPATSGLRGNPTVINNVETLGHVPGIILNGADWFRSFGTPTNPGTKTFALTGKVNNTGLVEIPFGLTIRQIIFDIGGGVEGGKKFKAVQIGGPSGGCLPATHLDYGIDYESLTSAGAIMGSGGLVVLSEDDCMVEVARYFMKFTQNESCGKCVPCREGTKRMLEILTRITSGDGREEDLDLLQEIATTVKDGSLCQLGKTAPNPVLTTLRYFHDEYIAHICEQKCPARVCPPLISYYIAPDKCKACMICLRKCPIGAITGGKKEVHVIDQDKCNRCGICLSVCPERFAAVTCIPGRLK